MENNHLHKELEDELKNAPILQSLKGNSTFQAPENYFDSLSSNIQDRISSTNKSTFVIPVFRPAFAGFSLALMLISIAIIYFSQDENKKSDLQAQEIGSPIIDEMIESGYYIDLEESHISETLCDLQIKTESSKTTSDIELENYLIQSMNETSLINEL